MPRPGDAGGVTYASGLRSYFSVLLRLGVLLGVFTGNRAIKGIATHVERALELGATKEEIISAIYLALPVCGIANVNLALEQAMITYNRVTTKAENEAH